MGGNPRKNPPKFSIHRSYERYRSELKAWIDLADYEKEQVALIVALDMPTSADEGDVRGKIFDDLGDDLKGEDGIKKLTQHRHMKIQNYKAVARLRYRQNLELKRQIY